ncbi:uncharacterized protein LOC128989536 [Macrosteles quadrilineatus]|uniref:uncharacterized protein LOC128989536 n=1 Tax=Macrosteles quadrilineatus TaxID=74068 RepID=UPI0023E1B4C7|nr:uncharacterized protein LOC128989536 [Macrosteles quadrilineatus]
MEALLKRRKALRTTFSRSVSKFNEVCQEELDEANALYDVLEQRYNELEEIDKEVLNLMLVERPDEEIEAELAKQDEYKKAYGLIKYKLRVSNRLEDEARSLGDSVSNNSTLVPKHNTVRLPKVELIKFGGDPKDWLHFWSLFQTIDREPTLNAAEKFQYLLQSMIPRSRAYEVVKSFPPTADNYPKALEELKGRFGRDGLLVQVYVRELLALVLKNTEHSLSLMQFYDKLECQLRALESLEVTTDKCACVLLPLVESCLPDDLLRAWQRCSLSSDGENKESSETEEQTLKRLRQFIKSEVEGE